MININGVQNVDDANVEKGAVAMTNEELTAQIMELKKQLDAAQEAKKGGTKVPKNKVVGKADPNRKYVLLSRTLNAWGKVPQQQADIAKLLVSKMDLNKEYSEKEVFDFMIDGSGDYKSITSSVQDPTYLLRYYRGLKNDGKHAGLVARGFLRVIG